MKHYLKCNNCNKLNEIKSEYMVLCSFCGKRMQNNYTEWKLSNAGKTFEDYKELVGKREEEVSNPAQDQLEKGKQKSKALVKKLLIVAITIAAAVFGTWLGSTAIKALQNGKKTAEIKESQWKKKTYGDFGLTVETPWILTPTKDELPLEAKVNALIDKMQTYENPSEDFKVIVNSIKYSPEIGEVNFRGGADGAINGMKNVPGVTDFVYDEQPYSSGNIPGVIQKGSYKLSNINIEFINVMVMQNLNAWQVNILYKADDKVAKKAAERIAKSFKIE